MFSLIVDVIFRPIYGIKNCVSNSKAWDSVFILLIIISANFLALKIPLKEVLPFFIKGVSLYIIFYGSVIASGSMILGKKMNIFNNYAYPYVLLPFSMLSSVYLTLNSANKQYLLIIFIFAWAIFLEFLYVKETFREKDKTVGILNSISIVSYAYLMRVLILVAFIMSNKFYWPR